MHFLLMAMIRLHNKIKGSTIVEILVALAILSVCSALAVLIYLNIHKNSLPFVRIKAMELAKAELNKTLDNKDYFDKTIEADGFHIIKSIKSADNFADCSTLRLIVFDANKKKVAELERMIYTGNEK